VSYLKIAKNIGNRIPFVARFIARLDGPMKDLLRRTSTAMMMRIMRTGVSFIFNVILARSLGAEGLGVYFLAYTVTRIAQIIAKFGLHQALLRFVAGSASQGEWEKVAGVYRLAILISSSLAVVATGIVFVAAPLFADFFNEPTLIEPLRIMSLTILPWALIFLYSHLLQALERIGDAIFVETIGLPLVNIPMVILLANAYGVVGAAISYLIANVLVLLLGVLLWRRATPQIREVKGDFDRRVLIETSMPLFWTDFIVLVLGMTDTIILGRVADSEAVGIYDTAKRVSILASSMLSAISVVAAPKFAAMYAKGELDKLGRLARQSAKFATLVSLPYLALFILAPDFVLSIFGSEFSNGGVALMILSLGEFVNAVTGSVGFLLIMTGHEKLMRNNALFAGILKIVLQITLIPLFGFVGAALAAVISSSVRNLTAVVLVYWKLSIITIPIPDRFARRLTQNAAQTG